MHATNETTRKPRFSRKPRTIIGGYRQDRTGAWWIFNAQRGWVQVNVDGAAFRECIDYQNKAEAILGRPFGGSIFEAERIIRRAQDH